MIGTLYQRRGSTAKRISSVLGPDEFFIDTDTMLVYVGDGTTAGGLLLSAKPATLTKTSGYSIAQSDNGLHFNSSGALGNITFWLPAAAAGLSYGFAIDSPYYMKILAAASDVILIGGDSSAAGGFVQSNIDSAYLVLVAHGVGKWKTASIVGPWSIDS